MNQDNGKWEGEQPEWPARQKFPNWPAVPPAPKAGGGGSQDGAAPVHRGVPLLCPACGTVICAHSAGVRWCANCNKAIAVDDGRQARLGEVLEEGVLADLICDEDDVAVWYDPEGGLSPGADPTLRADFSVEQTFWEDDEQLLAEIDEDLDHFESPDAEL